MSKATSRKRRKQSRWTLYMVVAGAVLMVVAVVIILATRDDSSADAADQRAGIQVVQPREADFSLPGLDGSVSLADYRGSYVLVNFWATWCPPCKAEMPDLNAYHLAYRNLGFTVLAVNAGETADTVRAFITETGFQFPVALDQTGAVFSQYGGDSLPTSFLIDPDGRLVKAWRPGMVTRDMLERDVTPLLKG